MLDDRPIDDWTADYLLDNAPEVMEYVLRGRRFGKTTLHGLRSDYEFALLREAVADLTEAQSIEFADLNTEFALRREERPDASLSALRWLADRRKNGPPKTAMTMAGEASTTPSIDCI